MNGAETWARAHKGLVALVAALAAGLAVLLLVIHPKGKQAAQSAISYIPAQFASSAPTTAPPTDQAAASGGVAYQVSSALGTIPVWLHAAASNESPVAALLRPGEALWTTGAPIKGGSYNGSDQWVPVNVAGTTYYALAKEVAFSGPQTGPPIGLKQTLSNVPASSAVMSGVG